MTLPASSAKGRRITSSKKLPQGLPGASDERSHDGAYLKDALEELTRLVKQFPSADASLGENIFSLRRELRERSSGEFTSRVKNQDDFRAKLSQLVCARKQARFDADTRTAANNLLVFFRKLKREETPRYWRAFTLLYELNDIFHLDPTLSIEAMKVGREVLGKLQALSPAWGSKEQIALEERRLIKEKILFCACRGNELKRLGRMQEALHLFEWLFKFASEKLQQPEVFPCFGARASLSYHLGSIHRIMEQHNRAEDKYTETLDLLYERTRHRGDSDPDDHLFTMRKQAMVIGVGFDPVVPSYIELLYGTIKRCRAGSDPVELRKAVESFSRARDEFEAYGHQRYVARACWELCLSYILLGELDDAVENLEVVAEQAERTGHPKWRTNVSIGRSRILRKKGDLKGALNAALVAVEQAGQCNSILPMVDAYITLGEARFFTAENAATGEGDYQLARAEFEMALREALGGPRPDRTTNLPSNPKIVAACNLRIAQCYAREGNESRAKEHFAEWEILRSNVEHEWLRELAAQVKSEIDGLAKNFTIAANNQGEWDYAENIASLRRWLLAQALRQTRRNYSEAAKLLGVKRGTLYQWQDDSRGRAKRARTNGGEFRSRNRGEKD
jgi:tetratricopeptide (TPR) repeat protein